MIKSRCRMLREHWRTLLCDWASQYHHEQYFHQGARGSPHIFSSLLIMSGCTLASQVCILAALTLFYASIVVILTLSSLYPSSVAQQLSTSSKKCFKMDRSVFHGSMWHVEWWRVRYLLRVSLFLLEDTAGTSNRFYISSFPLSKLNAQFPHRVWSQTCGSIGKIIDHFCQ